MAFLAAAIPYIGTILGVAGKARSAKAARKQGRQLLALRNEQAVDIERQAVEVKAIAQRQAIDEQEKAELLISRAQAVAAASGGSATDQTVLDVMSDIEGEGAYRAAMAMYQGEREAETLRQEAKYTRAGGEISRQESNARARAYEMEAVGTIAQGATTFYDRYNKGRLSSGLSTT